MSTWRLGRVERRRGGGQVNGFHSYQPFRAAWQNGHQTVHSVSSTPSKIPYGGFSPVRLQAGCQTRPSPSCDGFDAATVALSASYVLFRSRTCVRRHTRLCRHTPAQRPLAPPRFYCPLASSLTMAASELLSVTAGFCSLCHRLHDRQKFPNLLRQGLIPCRRPYSGGSSAPTDEPAR